MRGVVYHARDKLVVIIGQRKRPAIDRVSVSIGKPELDGKVIVGIASSRTDESVVNDALQLVSTRD